MLAQAPFASTRPHGSRRDSQAFTSTLPVQDRVMFCQLCAPIGDVSSTTAPFALPNTETKEPRAIKMVDV